MKQHFKINFINELSSFEKMKKNRFNTLANFLGTDTLSQINAPVGYVKEVLNDSPSPRIYDIQRAPDSAAMFDILIERKTANIASNLPVPIFGALDFESDYTEILPASLPAGCTYVIEKTSDKKGLKITYTVGPNSDIIEINCVQNAYNNLLRATQGSILQLEQNKLNISDVAEVAQFAQKVQVVKNTLFGRDTNDSFTPNQFKTDMQNQNDIRVITQNFSIDAESSFIILVRPVASFTIGWTSYVSKFSTSRA